MMRICPHCKSQFSHRRPNAIYCSPRCTGRAAERRKERRPSRRRQRQRERQLRRDREKRLRRRLSAKCLTCGADMNIGMRGILRKYCSPQCRPSVIALRKSKCCPICGQNFFGPNHRYCSPECRAAFNRHRLERQKKPPPPPRLCLFCKQEFQPRRSTQIYCDGHSDRRSELKQYRRTAYQAIRSIDPEFFSFFNSRKNARERDRMDRQRLAALIVEQLMEGSRK